MNTTKNILFLMTDQQRLDYTGFGGGEVSTPNIDRLAESIGFTCCQTVNPICMPTRTALITGKYPHQIGTLGQSGDLSLRHPTFMQALQRAGYHTSGVGKFHFLQTWWKPERGKGVNLTAVKDRISEYGYDYVWETAGKQLALANYCDYGRYLESKGLLGKYRDFIEACWKNDENLEFEREGGNRWPFDDEDYVDVVTGDKIIEQIRNRPRNQPFYIFGSFCSPHKPFDPPRSYLDKIDYEEKDDFIAGDRELTAEDKELLYRRRRSYKAMIKLVDDQIGRICDALEKEGILDNTVILFTSDHGDMMGDHTSTRKPPDPAGQKSLPWKESLTVPLAIRHPDWLSYRQNNTPVEITDLTATILDIAGLDAQRELAKQWPFYNDIVPCRSLMPVIRGEIERVREFTYSENQAGWRALQTEKWKYVRYLNFEDPDRPGEKLFNLENDPDEQFNAAFEYPDILTWFRNRYLHLLERTPAAQSSWAPLMNK